MSTPDWCPTPWKEAFFDRAAALKSIGAHKSKSKGASKIRSIYRCASGRHWHVTSRTRKGRHGTRTSSNR